MHVRIFFERCFIVLETSQSTEQFEAYTSGQQEAIHQEIFKIL